MPSKSIQQQKFFGMVSRCKKTGICPSEKIKNAAKSMTKKQIHDFAATPHANLPKKVKKKKKKKYKTFKEFYQIKESANCHNPNCTCIDCSN